MRQRCTDNTAIQARRRRARTKVELRAGFTLVEMLVATALMIFLMVIFTGLFLAATTGVSQMRGITEADQKVRSVVNTIKRDLDNVMLLDRIGLQLTPGQLFGGPDQIPSGGYFTIEENSPAAFYPDAETATWAAGDFVPKNGHLRLRQGVDQNGVPVEIDTDDVIAFTTQQTGTSADKIFYGRVPVGGILDGVGLAPETRFDRSGNGLFTSRVAEVIYFLRPNVQQPMLTDVNNPPNKDNTAAINPPVPATYTLYRRQLLVLSDMDVRQLNDLVMRYSAPPAGPSGIVHSWAAIPAGQSFFQHYDISVHFDPDIYNAGSNVPGLRFNTMSRLAQRENRFGMIWLTDGALNRRELPFIPSATFYQNGVHDPADVNHRWIGRPTQWESSHGTFTTLPAPGGAVPPPLGTFPTLDLADADQNGVADAYDAEAAGSVTPGRRRGEDILLTNVVSFDVKVFDDDFFHGTPVAHPPNNPRDWPASKTNPKATGKGSGKGKGKKAKAKGKGVTTSDPTISAETLVINPLAKTVKAATPDTRRRHEFIDLGYRAQHSAQASGAREDLVYELNIEFADSESPPNHTPARWRTTGRASSIANFNPPNEPFSVTWPNPVSTYDSWWTGYNIDDSDTFPLPTAMDPDGGDGIYDPGPDPTMDDRDLRPPPYERPLRGVQITLRVLEPKSGIVRTFEVVHAFRSE